MFPNFVGIGVPRGGSTWLHELLETHPQVAVPIRRKEVHYFDSRYDRGESWYRSFFPPEEEAHRYRAVGEITPHYLYNEHCPQRIAAMPSIKRILLILRNPVDRAFSHFVWRARLDNYRKPFRAFLQDYPKAVEWGRYAPYIEHYFEHHERSKFLILIQEEAVRDVLGTRQRVAAHLGIDAALFPDNAGFARVNRAEVPRFAGAYRIVSKIGSRLRRMDMDWIPNLLGRKLGLKHVIGFGGGRKKPILRDDDRRFLHDLYAQDNEHLERLLGREIPAWRITQDEHSPG